MQLGTAGHNILCTLKSLSLKFGLGGWSCTEFPFYVALAIIKVKFEGQ